MAKGARQGDFLHVLEGGKAAGSSTGSGSKSQASGKTPRSKARATPKPTPKSGPTAPKRAGRSRRHRRSWSDFNRAWGNARRQLSRRLTRLNRNLHRRGRRLVRRLKSRTTRRWLGRQVNGLILMGVLLAGAALAWGSHRLVAWRAEAGLEQLLTLGETVARGEEPAPELLANPWGWQPIGVERQGKTIWLQVDGVSLRGCRTLIERARGRFTALTVNDRPAAPAACDNTDNRLGVQVAP